MIATAPGRQRFRGTQVEGGLSVKPVIQEEPTGCGIAAVAAIVGVTYAHANAVAGALGIFADDPRLWSDTAHIRQLLAQFGRHVPASPQPFRSWKSLPACALLAVKWHVEAGRPFWHWVVFARENGQALVLDSKQSLKVHCRTDLGRLKPKWYLRVSMKSRSRVCNPNR